MLAEQTLLNAAVLTVDATASDAALAGIVFNVLLIVRAPLQLFQAVQTSLLPHLAGLEATQGHDAFRRAIRVDGAGHRRLRGSRWRSGCSRSARSSWSSLFGQDFDYDRVGLALVGHRDGAPPDRRDAQPGALARGRRGCAAARWLARRGGVRGVDAAAAGRRPAAARRGRLRPRHRPVVRAPARLCTGWGGRADEARMRLAPHRPRRGLRGASRAPAHRLRRHRPQRPPDRRLRP